MSKNLWGTIYFLRSGEFVKIGHTTMNLERRLKSYATHSLEGTELLGFTHGTRTLEREFHGRFSTYREKGEWFRLEGELADFLIEELPLQQETTERLRMDEMRRFMSGEMQKVPRKVPPPVKKAPKHVGRKLISRNGKVFNIRGKRVLAVKAGDYFVEA